MKSVVGEPDAEKTPDEIQTTLVQIADLLSRAGVSEVDDAAGHLRELALEADVARFSDVLSVASLLGLTPEQERAEGAVNMLTMHKAKGLDARAVVIMACEDEYLPGRQQSVEAEADERRLLYVSLTRARERLYVTYAQERTGQQQHTGRDSGRLKRTLTRYLRSSPLHPEPASEFFEQLRS